MADWSEIRNPSSLNFKPLYTTVTIKEGDKQKALAWKSTVEIKEIDKICTAYAGAHDNKTRITLQVTNELVKLHETYLKRCSWPDFL